jgi:hypothetical protein
MSAHQVGLSSLSLELYLSHRWHVCTAGGDKEPQFVRGKAREPGEREKATREWESMQPLEPVKALAPERRIILTDEGL